MRSRIISLTSLVMMALTIMAQSIQKHQYWLDSDFDHHKTVYGNSLLSVTVSIEGLSPGVHFFNHRAMDSDDTWGTIYRTLFYIPSDPTSESTIQSYEYWIDSDYDNRKSGSGSTVMQATVDISSLAAGVHFFNYRALSSNGSWGTIYRTLFYIPSDPTSESTIQSYEYWIDSDYANRKSGSGSTVMQATVDISSLAAGVHFFNYRALSSNGSWGTIYRTLFYIPEGEIENLEIVEYEYWIDDDSEKKLSGTGNMDTYQLTIDVSQLAAGEHLFSFRAKNTNGEWSQLYQSKFTVDEPPAVETIVFADANVKAICVANWDTNGDGELSMDEAAVVSSLGDVFRNKDITSFDELQYFTGLTTIDSWAFSNCTAMQSVVLPESVTEIGENAFYNCPLIETLKIPAAVQTIGGSALARMTGLKTLTVDAASAYFTVEDDVLYTKDMSRLVCCLPGKIGTVTVNSKTKVLGECAFYLCEQLSSIILPEGLTTLEDGVFQGVTSMTEITLPASVVNMGVGCFYCPQLKAVKVAPGNLQYKSEDGVLYSKNGETLVYYPTARQGALYTVLDGTKTIDKYAFTVSLIQEVTLPESILLIDVGAFQDCGNMTTITCLAVEPPTVMSKGFYGDDFQYATVRVPYGSKDKYVVADGWGDFTNIVELPEPEPTYISLSDATITLVSTTYIYTGFAIEPEMTVQYQGTTLIKGIDYILSLSNNTEPGTATVTITGIGNYTGSISCTFTIVRDLSDAVLELIDGKKYVYSGNLIIPACAVMLNGQKLVADIDYTITCTDNVNVGIAKVIATGIGNYTGTVTATFTISKAMLTVNAANLTKVYGEENPDLTYAISGFVNDEDASVLTAMPVLNTDARTDSPVGIYRIRVSGGEARNYEFTYRDAVLTIMPKDLSDATVTLDAEKYAYNGNSILPVVTVKCGSVVLVENTDYSLSATNDVEPGIATLTIQGVGNYCGTIDTTFVIYLKPSVEVIINGFTIDPILYELQRCSAPALFEAEQGTVEVDNYYALSGNVVSLSITPKSAYYVSKEDITGVDLVGNDPSNLRETRHYRYIVPESGLVTIKVTFTELVDGINSVDGDDDAAFDVYDLSGRKVRRQATTLSDLPKGVYIIGGRKQVVR